MSKKLTLDIVKERIKNKNSNIEVLSTEYINNSTKIKCKCLLDGYEWMAIPADLLQGKGCPMCSGNMKLTIDTVKDNLKVLNPNIEILSDEDINNRTKIRYKCKLCNKEHESLYSTLKRGNPCPKCVNDRTHNILKLGIDVAIERLTEIHPNLEILSDKYDNNRTNIKYRCNTCGHEDEASFGDLIRSKYGCSECANKGRSDNQKHTLDYIKEKLNPDVEMLSTEYVNSNTKLKVKCKICKKEWETTSSLLIKGSSCPKCSKEKAAKKRSLTIDIVKDRLKDINPDIEILSKEYINSDVKLKVKCKLCNHEWEAKWGNLSQGKGCPKCKYSKGEKDISDWLESNDIDFTPQYKIKECRNKLPLPFDFYLPDYNVLIEYNGMQHYQKTGWDYTEDKLSRTIINDNIKKKYCEDNDIELIIIPYWNLKNIKEILDKRFNLPPNTAINT